MQTHLNKKISQGAPVPEVSILLPSLRPDAVALKVKQFQETNPDMDYELVVVSPFEIVGEKVVHVLETERRGVIHAINQAYTHAQGKFIVLWSDDATPEAGCLKAIIEFVKGKQTPFLASFRRRDIRGVEHEQWAVYGKLYAGWLCADRATFELVGGLFNPAYRNYWADPDLSLRVWENGGEVAVCREAWINVEQINDQVKSENLKSSFEIDTETFFGYWHSKLGKGKRKDWESINVAIPHSLTGHVRALLRRIPHLRKLKNYLQGVLGKPSLQH